MNDALQATPEEIGEAHARHIWETRGRAALILPSAYQKSLYELSEQTRDPRARRSFEQGLMRLGANSRQIIQPSRRRCR